ncbi:fused response regulator/phosphatase [Paracoccus gahaiensis]|uniref:Fused response regulator/phosphatase n=1 Tax=Paracoccus gahaiensis TaxID=1706839 RepID=A0A4U0R601_9RHOB|nr:fused response regulator/phosphatase [Paracoccus gahaiensis]TJZ89800.1 fused response regulator/phosphatase [Paracoccus gahaiensis]
MTVANRPSPVFGPPRPRPRRLVLLVDDSAAWRRVLGGLLKMGGYEVIEAASGAEALDLCTRLSPDLVLTDWAMTDMSGLDFCTAFRRLPRSNYGYVLLQTTDTAAQAISAGLEAGVDDFLTKPVIAQDLLARLSACERILRIQEELQETNAHLRQAMMQLSDAQAVMERDLCEARKLQQGLVRERSGQFGPFEISLLLRPAGHIGGDLVGFFPIGPDRLGLYALDVSGHGVTAALLTAQLSVHLSAAADGNIAQRGAQDAAGGAGPAALAQFFNAMMLEEMSTDTYFTMIYGELDRLTGQVRMVQAGHPHPALQRADGTITHLGRGGMPIGLFEDPLFDEIEVTLLPGDRLLITSDGITEAAAPDGRQLGAEGLDAVMRTNALLQGHAFLESMTWSVSEFCRGERQDDMSALLVEFHATGRVIRLENGP